MACFAALDQTQNALAEETAQALACGADGKPSALGEPAYGKMEPEFALKAAVPEKMIVDGTVDDGKAEARDEQVFDLFAH